MKPPPFDYHAPRSIDEVVALLGSLENSRLLAGGQSLIAMMNMRFATPDHVIDLNRVDGLSSIRVTPTHLEIGAMTLQRDIEFSKDIEATFPIITEAIKQVGHRQTRNRGTIGGSLCHLDPSAELVTLCSLLDASVTIVGSAGSRAIPFSEFPAGYLTTSLQPDECLTGISIPLWPSPHGFSFVEVARRHGDFAIVSAGVMLELAAQGFVTRIAIALGGVDFAPVRMTALEERLVGSPLSDDAISNIGGSFDQLEPIDDVHATAKYRRRLAVSMTQRAMRTAAHRALVSN
jgi:carbon-monoxide dehydrogenase medium subunit